MWWCDLTKLLIRSCLHAFVCICLSNRKLLSRELTDASKVEDEIKKILSELKKSLTSQPASDKGQTNQLITWYDLDGSNLRGTFWCTVYGQFVYQDMGMLHRGRWVKCGSLHMCWYDTLSNLNLSCTSTFYPGIFFCYPTYLLSFYCMSLIMWFNDRFHKFQKYQDIA